MSDAPKKPNPAEDLSEGLGLLFRAAKTAVEQIPTDSVESFMSTTAGAVGRAFDVVGGAIEREISGQPGAAPPADAQGAPAEAPPAAPDAAPAPVAAKEPAPDGAAAPAAGPKPDGDEPRGPRVA
jgi:hypothetical protein